MRGWPARSLLLLVILGTLPGCVITCGLWTRAGTYVDSVDCSPDEANVMAFTAASPYRQAPTAEEEVGVLLRAPRAWRTTDGGLAVDYMLATRSHWYGLPTDVPGFDKAVPGQLALPASALTRAPLMRWPDGAQALSAATNPSPISDFARFRHDDRSLPVVRVVSRDGLPPPWWSEEECLYAIVSNRPARDSIDVPVQPDVYWYVPEPGTARAGRFVRVPLPPPELSRSGWRWPWRVLMTPLTLVEDVLADIVVVLSWPLVGSMYAEQDEPEPCAPWKPALADA